MTEAETEKFLNKATDGQTIRVTVASGRVFDGVYDGAHTTPDDALYFETMEGTACRAEWPNIVEISYRSARTMGRSMMVPPEHPLSGVSRQQTGPNGGPMRPYTTRNR